MLRRIRPVGAADVERKRQCTEHLVELRRRDAQLVELRKRTVDASAPRRRRWSRSTVSGPSWPPYRRPHRWRGSFPDLGHFARFNGTPPMDASSGEVTRHRLNPRGNRRLNHALHAAAVTQVAHDTPGRAFYLRKLEDGHGRREALRALKRRISDAVHRQLAADAKSGAGRTSRDDLKAA